MKSFAQAVVLVLVVAGCSRKKTLDTEKLAREAKAKLAEIGITATVTCPEATSMPKRDEVYRCSAVDERGAEIAVKVTMTDDDGNGRLGMGGGLLNLERLGERIKDKANLVMRCDRKAVVLKKGEQHQCEASKDGDKKLIVITMIDPATEEINWKVLRDLPEAFIKSMFAKEGLEATQIKCPKDAGAAKYSCDVTVGSESVQVEVTVGEKGNDYQLPDGVSFVPRTYAIDGKSVELDCPKRVAKLGDPVACTFQRAGKPYRAEATLEAGPVQRWKVTPLE